MVYRKGIIYKDKTWSDFICFSVYWGYVCTVGFYMFRLWSNESDKELEENMKGIGSM
jgi:hypothetical protein